MKVVAEGTSGGTSRRRSAGPHVKVTSLLSGPGTDPHLYEPDVASALAVAQARLVIANGAGYDDFMSQLLGATVNAGRVALSVQAVLGAYGPDVNPHFWYDIPWVPRVAAAIEAALARLDPADATVLAANLAAFDASLRPVEAVIASIRRRYPDAPVAYTERVPGCLLQAAGLEVVSPPGFAAAIENGNDPSPGDTAQMWPPRDLGRPQVRDGHRPWRTGTGRGSRPGPMVRIRATSARSPPVSLLMIGPPWSALSPRWPSADRGLGGTVRYVRLSAGAAAALSAVYAGSRAE